MTIEEVGFKHADSLLASWLAKRKVKNPAKIMRAAMVLVNSKCVAAPTVHMVADCICDMLTHTWVRGGRYAGLHVSYYGDSKRSENPVAELWVADWPSESVKVAMVTGRDRRWEPVIEWL